jgi:hypothetical protein
VVLSGWQGWLAATVATLLTAALVIGEITDKAMRRWWSGHALTTDTVSGLLVLLITLLVVDQVVRLRQIKNRSTAVAAQAAIILAQATRASREVSQAVTKGLGPGNRDDASDEFRSYMNMLLVGAPVLIDEPVARNFLEQAQALGGEMARVLAATGKESGSATVSTARLDDAVKRLRDAAIPLLAVLDPADQAAIRGTESSLLVRLPGSSGMTTLGASHSSRSAPRGRPQQTGRGHRNEVAVHDLAPGPALPGRLTVDNLRILRANGLAVDGPGQP